MTNTDAMRAQFEKQFPVEGGYVLFADGRYIPAHNHYIKSIDKAQRQQDRWEGWQASRVQPIVLPKPMYAATFNNYAYIAADVKAAITAQGYAVKESDS